LAQIRQPTSTIVATGRFRPKFVNLPPIVRIVGGWVQSYFHIGEGFEDRTQGCIVFAAKRDPPDGSRAKALQQFNPEQGLAHQGHAKVFRFVLCLYGYDVPAPDDIFRCVSDPSRVAPAPLPCFQVWDNQAVQPAAPAVPGTLDQREFQEKHPAYPTPVPFDHRGFVPGHSLVAFRQGLADQQPLRPSEAAVAQQQIFGARFVGVPDPDMGIFGYAERTAFGVRRLLPLFKHSYSPSALAGTGAAQRPHVLAN
jgi:hypothetical protein